MATTPEAQELGTLLRQLKERSGRSYGVLAGRLHVSTSTLHRYCNGDAVPAEFAVAERFARLCGAEREELIELHRRWIVADDARTRSRSAATVKPVESERERERERERESVPEADPGPGSVVVTDASTGPGAGGVSGTPDAPDASDAPDAPDAPDVPDVSEVPRAPGVHDRPDARSGGARRRRVLVVLAAAVVVAVAVPVAVFASGGDGGGRPERAAPVPAPSGPATGGALPVRPGPASSPAVTPTPSGTPTGSPSGPPDGKGSPSSPAPDPSRNPSPTAPGSGAPATGVPLRVGISSYNWEHPCGQYYLLDRDPGTVPPPPPPQDHRGWARSLGAVDGGGMRLELTATGRTADSVVINRVNVRVVGRSAALPWSAFSMGEGCGSGVTPQTFAVDLDRPQPGVRPVAGQNGDIVVPAKDFPYKVASHDPQVLRFDVTTKAYDVSWYLEVEWSSGDRRGTIRVDDGGRPFRTSATAGRPSYLWWVDPGEWRVDEGD
ncbi:MULTISPECIES: helix-turn-helix domain-containing protein [unclassified Streptomyces]|uniref:helix-turn-helix domain-containing protein n=1 Tax=unclassified Streptomyces TaxID=2593676 RepID=UPI0035D7ABB7